MKKLILIFILCCKENIKKDFRAYESLKSSKELEKFLASESSEIIENDDKCKLENLLSKGLRINRKYDNETLLFKAFKNNKVECIKYLLSKGAIVSEEFSEFDLNCGINSEIIRSIPLDLSDESEITFGVLKKRQKKLLNNINIHFENTNQEEYILDRIKKGANVNITSEIYYNRKIFKLNIFCLLSEVGTDKIAKELFRRYEGDINEINDDGLTAFSDSIPNVEFSEILLANGANPNIYISKDLRQSPLVYAIYNWPINRSKNFLENIIAKTFREDILNEALISIEKLAYTSELEDVVSKIKCKIKK